MKKIVIATLLFAVGCSSHGESRYAVDGAETDFCLPKENTIADIPWVPRDQPNVPKGFAFQACWQADNSVSPTCSIPFLRGADVNPLSTFKVRYLRDFSPGAFYRDVAFDPSTKLEAMAAGSIVVASNAALTPQWFIWKKAVPVTTGKPTLTGDDEIIASCQTDSVYIPYKGGTRQMVSCTRTFAAKDLAITYHFETHKGERVPSNVAQLDASVLATLNRWRCPKL